MGISRADAGLLARRTGFGAVPTDVTALTALSWDAAVDRVLTTSTEPSRTAGAPALPAPGTALDAAAWGDAYRKMVWWWLDRCRTTPTPIVEKLTLFWHGHLCSTLDLVPHRLMFDQLQVIRARALGPVADMMKAVAVTPAMLITLDNRSNAVVDGLRYGNENWARELMELFTLGIGHYTEVDVRESARAWSGHTMNTATWTYQFRSDWHDHANKTFMGVTRNWDGPQIIDHIVTGPKRVDSARFLCRKVWEFFSYANPSADLVEHLVIAYLNGGLQMKPLVRAILAHPEFRSARSRTGLVRSPADWVTATMRHAGVTCADTSPQWQMKGMGQELYMPPNVDGWGPSRNWVSTSAVWAKMNFAANVANKSRALTGTENLSVDAAVAQALDTFGILEPSAATRTALTEFVTGARSDRRGAERNGLITMCLLAPEFQLA